MSKNLNVDIFEIFNEQWALVTSGNSEDFNTMTISWGGLGTLWNKNVATVYVRPTRYTYEYMEKNDCFTISFFDKSYKEDLSILGRVSGRDEDKIALTKLTPKILHEGIGFDEAKMTLVCKKIYFQDMDKDKMPKEVLENHYPQGDIHRMYVGEVVEIIS